MKLSFSNDFELDIWCPHCEKSHIHGISVEVSVPEAYILKGNRIEIEEQEIEVATFEVKAIKEITK